MPDNQSILNVMGKTMKMIKLLICICVFNILTMNVSQAVDQPQTLSYLEMSDYVFNHFENSSPKWFPGRQVTQVESINNQNAYFRVYPETLIYSWVDGNIWYKHGNNEWQMSGSVNALYNSLIQVTKTKKAVLLLHGLASDEETWNDLVYDQFGFDGNCTSLSTNASLKSPNSEGVHCFRINFGSFDTVSNLKGLEGIVCHDHGGCSGDFSSYSDLGREVESAINKIRLLLGSDVEVVLLGHSRGGLSARAFLQRHGLNHSSQASGNVVALITTGTPHLGSPLGKVYNYIKDNCLPKEDHSNDNGACENDWKAADLIREISPLDLRRPSIGLLSDDSQEIKSLNNSANKLSANLEYVQITYVAEELGNLAKVNLGGVKITINPFPSVIKPIDFAVQDFSKQAEFAILGENSYEAAVELHGDGIVPAKSQRLTEVSGFNASASLFVSLDKVLHIEETSRVTDLYYALELVYGQIGW